MIRVFLFLVFLVPNYAQINNKQQLDSLYDAFMERYNHKNEIVNSTQSPEHIKCAFGIVNEIRRNLNNYSGEQRRLLKTLLERPSKQKSIVSPKGYFRIHYDITGSDVPNYNSSLSADENAIQVAIAADSAYSFEVNYLGYPEPPPDYNEGGDDKYDIYIIDYGGTYYGGTTTETSIGESKYTSFMMIDNDYAGYYCKGISGAEVTVAHEFHHAIQVGNYTGDKYDVDGFFYEITSTSMEEFVYDSVNDYYAYMKSYFSNPNRVFNSFRYRSNDGYDLAIWNIFLKDKFGFDIIKKQWEQFRYTRALTAIQSSLLDESSSLSESLNEFGIWIFFTNYRTVPGKYFEEASSYPLIKLKQDIPYFPSSPISFSDIRASSNNFLRISSNDTLVVIITNSDYAMANDSSGKNFNFEYTIAHDSTEGSVKLTDNYFAKFNVDQPNLWSVSEILNNQVVRQNGTVFQPITAGEEPLAYPNPFHYGLNQYIYIVVSDTKGESKADFNVYTPAMELVDSKTLDFNGDILTWKIRDLNEKLASGVYIFAVKIGNKTSAGKLVIFDD